MTASVTHSFVKFAKLKLTAVDRSNDFLIGAVCQSASILWIIIEDILNTSAHTLENRTKTPNSKSDVKGSRHT